MIAAYARGHGFNRCGSSTMRLASSLFVAALALVLSGCMTAEQQRSADEAKCRSYGFKHNNDAFAECLQRIELDRRAEARAAHRFDPFLEPRVIYRPVIVQRPRPRPTP